MGTLLEHDLILLLCTIQDQSLCLDQEEWGAWNHTKKAVPVVILESRNVTIVKLMWNMGDVADKQVQDLTCSSPRQRWVIHVFVQFFISPRVVSDHCIPVDWWRLYYDVY